MEKILRKVWGRIHLLQCAPNGIADQLIRDRSKGTRTPVIFDAGKMQLIIQEGPVVRGRMCCD